jgi:hypothetical protein
LRGADCSPCYRCRQQHHQLVYTHALPVLARQTDMHGADSCLGEQVTWLNHACCCGAHAQPPSSSSAIGWGEGAVLGAWFMGFCKQCMSVWVCALCAEVVALAAGPEQVCCQDGHGRQHAQVCSSCLLPAQASWEASHHGSRQRHASRWSSIIWAIIQPPWVLARALEVLTGACEQGRQVPSATSTTQWYSVVPLCSTFRYYLGVGSPALGCASPAPELAV